VRFAEDVKSTVNEYLAETRQRGLKR
jgi:hypothetical protein